jgi:hypothetical protein
MAGILHQRTAIARVGPTAKVDAGRGPPCPTDTGPKRARYRFLPTQHVWQCNDIRVTWTNPAPGVFNYDIGGTIWCGINFTATDTGLFLRGVPCVPLR